MLSYSEIDELTMEELTHYVENESNYLNEHTIINTSEIEERFCRLHYAQGLLRSRLED